MCVCVHECVHIYTHIHTNGPITMKAVRCIYQYCVSKKWARTMQADILDA